VNRRQRKRERKRARLAALQRQQQSQPFSTELVVPGVDSIQSEVAQDVRATRMNSNPQRQTRQQLQLAAEFHSGPLPHPDVLARYNETVQNGAERLMQSFEKQQAHRQELEKKVIFGNVDAEKRGQWMGLTVSLAVLGLAAYVAHLGNAWAGGGIAVADIATLAGVFVYGKSKQRKELAEKRERLKPKK
jgi:uncharacterized membrane protein